MTLFTVIIIVVIALSFIAFWRNEWNIKKAWEAVVLFIGALIAAGVHLWGGVQ